MTSVYNFVDGSPYILNQLFGYQDAEESRQRPLRLRDALALQHRWVNTGAAVPDIGTHYGNIGDVTTPANTVYYGDGSNLVNVNKGGWADLTRTGFSIGGTLLSGGNQAATRISNYSSFWHMEYVNSGMVPNVWYRNFPSTGPSSPNSLTEIGSVTHRFIHAGGTFKLGVCCGVINAFINTNQTPVVAGAYLETIPYLVNISGIATYIDPVASPAVRLYYDATDNNGYVNKFGAFKTTWQFNNVPQGRYAIGWQTYCNNPTRAVGPYVIIHTGLDWDMMSRTPAGISSYFFNWLSQLWAWYPTRPSLGHNLFLNNPMWTED